MVIVFSDGVYAVHPTDQAMSVCRAMLSLELPGFWRRGHTAAEAIATIERAVTEEVSSSTSCGWPLPAPLTDRKYSGKFVVRMPSTLHAHLAVEAAEQGVSLNQWVLHKLTNRPLAQPF